MSQLPPGFVLDGAPTTSGPVYGPPPKAAPPPTPFQVEDQAIQRDAASRSAGADARAAAAAERSALEWSATHLPNGTPKPNAAADKLNVIPAGAAGGIQENMKTLRAIETALQQLDSRPGSIGPGTGALGDTFTQFNDANGTDVRATIGNVGAYKIHDLSGAAVTASEAPRFKPFIPTVTDRPDVARTKLERLRTELQGTIGEAVNFYSPANGYRPYTTPGIEAFTGPAGAQNDQQQAQPPAFGGAVVPPAAPPSPGGPATPPPTAGPPSRPVPGLGMDNGGNGGQQIAQGDTQRIDNPVLAGVRDEYIRRLRRGDNPVQLVSWAKGVGVDPSAFRSIAAQAMFRKRNPQVPVEQYDTSQLDDTFVPLSGGEQLLNQIAMSAPGAAAIAAGNALTGNNMDSIIGATGGDADRARLGMNEIANEHPLADLGGTIGGGLLAALGAEGALGASGIAAGAGRTLAADALYGGAAGAGGTDVNAEGDPASLGDRAIGAGKGVAAAMVGSKAGNLVSKGARGVADASVQALQDTGIPLTVGQAFARSGRVGVMVKGAEDRLAGIPLVGDMINARRAEGVRRFNSGAFDKALEPIKGAVGDKVGEEAVDFAQQQVSDAFQAALQGRFVQADRQFANDLLKASTITTSLPRVGQEVSDSVQTILTPYMTGQTLTGEAMQQISRELRALKSGYQKDPLGHRIGQAIDANEDAIFGMFKRQTPDVLPAYNSAKNAQRRLYILGDAVNRAKNREGVFTPAQLGMADRSNTTKLNGAMASARGKGQFHDYQRAAQNVLPNAVPDSGTAGRLLLPAVAGGMVGADAYGGGGVDNSTWTMAALLAGAYTKAGQRLLTKGARGANSRAGKALGSETGRKLLSGVGASTATVPIVQ